MFDLSAFTKAGAAAERRAAAVFYKGFDALARDSDLREACGDDHTVALGALSLTADLLMGTVTLSPEHIQIGAFRDLARQRGLAEIAERTELQHAEEARKPVSKRKHCEVFLSTEPDQELASFMENEGFRRVENPSEHPVVFEGLGCAKALKARLRPEDRIILRSVVAGTRHSANSSEARPDADTEREEHILPPGVEPYVVATVSPPEGVTFQKASLEHLSETIIRMVHIEAPINRSVVEKRLRTSFKLGSIRSVHDEKIDAAIQLAIDGKHLVRTEDDFFLPAAVDRIVPRYRTSEDEDVRATSNVSLIEIRAAIALQMESDPTHDRNLIVIRTARLLGFALRTEHINRLLSEKIKAEVEAIPRNDIDNDRTSPPASPNPTAAATRR